MFLDSIRKLVAISRSQALSAKTRAIPSCLRHGHSYQCVSPRAYFTLQENREALWLMNTLLILNVQFLQGKEVVWWVCCENSRNLAATSIGEFPPTLHFNTAVICRHHYLMKHIAVQEEQEAAFGNKGPAGNLAILVIWNFPNSQAASPSNAQLNLQSLSETTF